MSLSTRIAVVLCGVVVLTASVSAGLIFWRFDTQLVNAKLDDLERETEIQATRFANQIDELMRDVRVVAGTSPIQGIIRASTNGGIDPVDGSALEQWQHRLAVNFRESLRHKPNYLQLRFIGVADRGRELVRVDRNGPGGGIRIVNGPKLQRKATNDYFRRAVQRAAGSVYLSPINLNRERGQIQEPRTPVIRAAVPVRADSGEVFGIVVINFGLAETFRLLGKIAKPQHRYFLTNGDGAYLLNPSADTAFDFEFGEPHRASREFPMLKQVLAGETPQMSQAVEAEEQFVSVRRLDYGPPDLQRRLGIIVTDNYGDITAITSTVMQQIGLVVLLLLVLVLLAGLWLAQQTTAPIMRVAEAVRRMEHDETAWKRPEKLTTEAGELATALDEAFHTLQKRSEELDKTNRELKQFAYIASHDLQEPVRTISSFAKMLDSQYNDVLDEKGQKYMHFLVESSERMRALIHGLLEFSRLGQDSVPARVDLNNMLDDIQQDMGATISASGAKITVASLPILHIFEVETRLLFQNLISNAIKYVLEDQQPVIDISSEKSGQGWLFSVTDNGLGIEEEQREKVFLIFQRLHGRSSKYTGTGIGLAHCRKVVELHHGRIWVEANPSGGSRFCFILNEVFANE